MEEFIKRAEELAKGIIDTQSIYWDNPNGPYTYICPFCGAETYIGGSKDDQECKPDCLRNKAVKFLHNLHDYQENQKNK